MATANRIFAHANKVVVLNKALYYYNQQSASTLATINASKINDFIRATVMVRMNLENIGVYDDFKKGYRALCRKTCLCCYYYVVKALPPKKHEGLPAQHEAGIARDPALRQRRIQHNPPALHRTPDVVDTPDKRKGISTR